MTLPLTYEENPVGDGVLLSAVKIFDFANSTYARLAQESELAMLDWLQATVTSRVNINTYVCSKHLNKNHNAKRSLMRYVLQNRISRLTC